MRRLFTPEIDNIPGGVQRPFATAFFWRPCKELNSTADAELQKTGLDIDLQRIT